MSPFAFSLFALAALLATAHGNCITKHVGYRTPTVVNYEPVDFYPPGVEVHVDENNCPYGMHVVGEDITSCNKDSNLPPPSIDGPEDGTWSPYAVRCNWRECPHGGRITVKQYCRH